MFILDVGRTGGVSGPAPQRPNAGGGQGIQQGVFDSLQQIISSIVPFTQFTQNQITLYRPVTGVLNPLLGVPEEFGTNPGRRADIMAILNANPNNFAAIPHLMDTSQERRDSLRTAWNHVQDLARAGDRRPLEMLTRLGINEGIINNPTTVRNLPPRTLQSLYMMRELSSRFQTDWEDIQATVMDRSKQLLEINRSFQNLASGNR